MSVLLRANTDLVARAWIGSIPGFSTGMVAASLPRDTTAWAGTGFVQVEVVAGAPVSEVPMRMPVVSVNCWAVSPSSNKAPWGQANHLAELIEVACQDHPAIPRLLALGGSYPAARVHTAYLLTEPRRIYDDDGSYARFQFDMQLAWIEVPA